MTSETSNLKRPRCPGCGAERATRSRSRGVDHLIALTGRKPYRCPACRKRFHAFVADAPKHTPVASGERKESKRRRYDALRREAVVYFLALAVFAVLAFVITQERG
jgi:transcriptional regulator NrdR family protein